ncbi:MAG: RAMP superfamily CRISPR-associated protein [Pseudomonadota bacterium]
MPQGETYWNPYRLIPARETVERSAPVTDERFCGHTGMMECTLENLTPLFIGAQALGSVHPPMVRENRYRVIPGSSLKGMLRSLTEIVGGGCFVVKDPGSPVPNHMNACNKVDRLCISCRMFGAMERGAGARVHKGKVSVGDAVVQEERPRLKSFQVLLANNGVRHEPFYRSPHTGRRDGNSRKLYFHQPKHTESIRPVAENLRHRAPDVSAVMPGHHFDFNVQFTSLTDQELSLLLYVLHLEENVSVTVGPEKLSLKGPMRHKIGNAKPLGFGSCHIRLNRMTFLAEPAQRFSTMSSTHDRLLEGEDLRQETTRRLQRFVTDESPTMQALRKVMVWDEKDPREFHYPDFHWFRNPQNEQTPLKVL